MFTRTIRNFENIENSAIRQIVDVEFNELHDELSSCYYDFWKYGQSKPFVFEKKTYDVAENVEKSKKIFDTLHSRIFANRNKKINTI